MLTYTLKKTPGHPLYEQLYQSIRDDIAAGRLPAGSPPAVQARAGRPSGRERRHGGERLCPAAG